MAERMSGERLAEILAALTKNDSLIKALGIKAATTGEIVGFTDRDVRELLTELEALTAERDAAMKQVDRLRDERAESFERLARAVGGVGMTPYQAEVDLEIEARIKAVVSERDALLAKVATARAEGERAGIERARALIQCHHDDMRVCGITKLDNALAEEAGHATKAALPESPNSDKGKWGEGHAPPSIAFTPELIASIKEAQAKADKFIADLTEARKLPSGWQDWRVTI